MERMQNMNSIKNIAEEIILNEILCMYKIQRYQIREL